jgi:exodeoxyribonuclease-3
VGADDLGRKEQGVDLRMNAGRARPRRARPARTAVRPGARLRILSWNIRQGGGRRLPCIAAAIERHQPDVVIVNELRERTSHGFVEELSRAGLPFAVHNEPAGFEYGILVASRAPLRRLAESKPSTIVRRSLLEVELSDEFTIGALYGPMVTPQHGYFWDAVVEHAGHHRERSYLLIGDFNTCEAGVDCYKSPIAGSDQFLRLRDLGYCDLWRKHNPDHIEHTWFSFGRGGVPLNGFRIDHALATPALAQRATRCWYSHEERAQRLSDHSIMLVEFSAGRRA